MIKKVPKKSQTIEIKPSSTVKPRRRRKNEKKVKIEEEKKFIFKQYTKKICVTGLCRFYTSSIFHKNINCKWRTHYM